MFSGQVEAGGETVRLCLSWMPSTGGKVTPCGVSEDLRWSRAAMSNPSMRPGGSTIKTCSEATPFSPPPLLLSGPSCPCLLPGCQSPHFSPGCPQPLLTMGGTGTLLINMVAHSPLCSKWSRASWPPNTFMSANSFLTRVHCSHCAPVQCCDESLNYVSLFDSMDSHQAPLSMGFPRQE